MEPASELEGSFTVDGSATLAHTLALSSGTLPPRGPSKSKVEPI